MDVNERNKLTAFKWGSTRAALFLELATIGTCLNMTKHMPRIILLARDTSHFEHKSQPELLVTPLLASFAIAVDHPQSRAPLVKYR